MEPIRYFESVSMLEPRCPGCKAITRYEDGVYDERKQCLTCRNCKTPL